jgi:hypothetical protein
MIIFFTRLVLLLAVSIAFAIPLGAQTITFSGRVTDQSSGQGVSGAVVVAEGNATGTRLALTDANGNYSLPMGANINIRIRAYKTNYIFNPVMVGLFSLGPPLNGSFTQNFSGSNFPVLIVLRSPVLLTEDSSLSALVLDNVIQTRDPFSITNNDYFTSDKRTRLTLLLVDLDLYPNQGETLSIITVQAQDAQSHSFPLPVEDLRKVPGVPWLSQLIVRLPPELADVSEVTVTVTARGQVSNGAKIRLK